ncbi:hypothetical protein GE09DRAFT_1060931 [Coniochaeta sp. 2T2.1]|nr:hypothetical protein GE09DRAFT_1060931 [Coniochaeta sp. 2T2.1]
MLKDKSRSEDRSGRQSNCTRLHGANASLQYYLCKEANAWERFRNDINLRQDLLYPQYINRYKARQAARKRRQSIGLIRPSIVILDGPSPNEVEIAELARYR